MTEDLTPSEREHQRYLEGIALFNQHAFFEAHEIWEELWKDAEGDTKRFYQGLIQCAVSLEHMRRGNTAGARIVFGRCQKRFAAFPQVYLGVDIAALMEATARALAPALDPDGATAPAEAVWPVIKLR